MRQNRFGDIALRSEFDGALKDLNNRNAPRIFLKFVKKCVG